MSENQDARKKDIDYLQRVYPWQSREFIARAMDEGGSNNRKILKILSSHESGAFSGSKRLHHLN